jgi:hypothetical protein
MFAFIRRKEIVIHVALIAAILASTAISSAALENSSADVLENQSIGENKVTSAIYALQNEHQFQSFERPVSMASEKLQGSTDALLAIEHDATITCTTSELCSDPGPAVVLTEAVNGSNQGDLYFKIQCAASPCASRDIFWHVSMDFYVTNDNPSPYTVPFYTYIHGLGHYYLYDWRTGSGTVDGEFCANASFGGGSTCHFEASGVIPKEHINGDPNWGLDHFRIHVATASPYSLTSVTRTGTIQVSYDSSLLTTQMPSESANCKGGCYYGQAQGWAADPINTNTGTVSFIENDLELSTSAGRLSFGRTYVSSYIDKFSSPLGFGWVHNHDMRLIFPGANESGFVRFKDQSGNLYRFVTTQSEYR